MRYEKVDFDTGNYKFHTHLPDWFFYNRGDGGVPFNILLKDGIIPEIKAYKKMREYMLQFDKKAIFLDVGAHIGLASIPIALEGYDVIAVEPVTHTLLTGNIDLNDVDNFITVILAAAYDEKATLNIFVPEQDDNASLSNELALSGGATKAVHINTIVLDDYIEERKLQDRIRFIKIDVQGFEYNVLKGLKQTLALPQERHVLLEWDEGFMQKIGIDPAEIITFFSSLGFTREPWDTGDALFIKKI
jgi:methyltransferase, FkbM family